ncbi:MAG: hypothetical protein NT013_06165 [Planctomycetia bacterium]|nr:hypothetical protein [Planctomycetia bacterium]
MNKAFVRESDHDVRHCPFCGSLGQAVGRVTLDVWLKPEAHHFSIIAVSRRSAGPTLHFRQCNKLASRGRVVPKSSGR